MLKTFDKILPKITLLFVLAIFTCIPFHAFAQNGTPNSDVPPETPSSSIPPEDPSSTTPPDPSTGTTTTPPTSTPETPNSTTTPPAGTTTPPASGTPKNTGSALPPATTPTTSETPEAILPNTETVNEVGLSESNPNGVLPIALAGAIALGGGALFVLRANKKKNKKGNRCENIKKKLEQKRIELANTESQFSLQETLTEKLKEKLEDKKSEALGKVVKKAEEKILGSEETALAKAVAAGEKAVETYDSLSEKYEQGQELLVMLKNKLNGLKGEVQTLESAYATCIAGVTAGSALSGRGLNIVIPEGKDGIIIPHPERKRALIIVDIQTGFVNKRDEWIVSNVEAILKQGNYALCIDAIFHADKNSLWNKQEAWTFDLSPTVPEIKKLLDPKKTIFITKTTKSVFAAQSDLPQILKSQGIEEIHVVGYDTNDCVLATANDAFDAGFFTYVIEEGTDSSESEALRKAAIALLRENEMTNHSSLIKEKKSIEL